MTNKEAKEILWNRCQHTPETAEAIRVLSEERPQGEWTNTSPYDDKGECSLCCYLSKKYYKFCPNCGAAMEIKNISPDSGIREFDKKFADLVVFDDQPQRQLKSSDVHEDV